MKECDRNIIISMASRTDYKNELEDIVNKTSNQKLKQYISTILSLTEMEVREVE